MGTTEWETNLVPRALPFGIGRGEVDRLFSQPFPLPLGGVNAVDYKSNWTGLMCLIIIKFGPFSFCQELEFIFQFFISVTDTDVKRSIRVHCVVLLSQVLLSQVGSLFFFVLFFMT